VKPKDIVKGLSVAMAAFWVYGPSLQGKWLWDDGLEISQNPVLRSPGGWWEPWVRPQGMDYFPLKSSLQWVEWHLWGADTSGYHLVNVGLHLVSALLIWRLLHLLGVRAAILGGLIFAVHPLAVESVAWISELKNTLSLPPLLFAAIAYVEYDRGGRRSTQVSALLWFLASLLCKTSTAMLPFVLLLYAWWRRGRISRRDILGAAPFFGVALAMGVVTIWFQSTRSIGLAGVQEGLWVRLAEAGWSIVAYARLSVWPAGLSPVYPFAAVSWTALLPWLGIAAVLGLFWTRRAGWGRHALLGSGWFLLNLVPVLGIIPMSYSRVSPRADHLAYVPLVGIAGLAAAAFGAALGRWEKRKGGGRLVRLPFAIGAMAVVCALAFVAHAHAGAFKGPKALWTLAVERDPGGWLPGSNLGKELLEEGHPDEAEVQVVEALKLQPDSFETRALLGNCLEAQGDPEGARREYAAALAINPRFAGAHYDLGVSLLKARQFGEAAPQFRAALAIDPAYASARNNLGVTLAATGDLAGARREYEGAIRIDPTLPEAHLNLGNALFMMRRTEDAVAEYREALRLSPAYAGAHQNLGYALQSLGRQDEADAEFGAARAAANR